MLFGIKARKGLPSFKDLLRQRLTRVSKEEISLIFFYNLDGEINAIVVAAVKVL